MTNMAEALKKAGYNTSKASSKGLTLTEDYVKKAEAVIRQLQENSRKNFRDPEYYNFKDLTVSKIRNILAMTSDLYNEAVFEKSDIIGENTKNRLNYLKIRLVYECGREPRVIKPFVEKARLLELIDGIGDNKDELLKVAHYMEALVAYHKFYGGRD